MFKQDKSGILATLANIISVGFVVLNRPSRVITASLAKIFVNSYVNT